MNAQDLADQAEDLQDQTRETARTLKDKAAQWSQTAKDKAASAAKTTDTYVRENPWTTIGVVALVAFTLGVLVGNRRD